jgi:predicted HTH domain antitoxin
MSDTYRLTIELPQTVKTLLPDAEQEAKRLIAMKIYQNGDVSVAWAARVAGMDRFAFASLLADYNIPIRQSTAEELMADADKIEYLLASSCS